MCECYARDAPKDQVYFSNFAVITMAHGGANFGSLLPIEDFSGFRTRGLVYGPFFSLERGLRRKRTSVSTGTHEQAFECHFIISQLLKFVGRELEIIFKFSTDEFGTCEI